MKVKPDKFEELMAMMSQDDRIESTSGYVSTTVYKSDADPNEYWLAVVFKDRESYQSNADSPEQGAMYEKMRACLEEDPEWHDGEIVAQDQARTT